ncbi:MAG TPA: outer membrane protein assembly factor BamE [Gemmatimonadota bacterium]|nr:outer membrane protein assembly factor BamE [Gemmatimonadota bacterium]
MSRIRVPTAVVLAVMLAAAGAGCGGGSDEAGSAEAVDSAAYQRTVATTLQPGMGQDEVRNKLGEPRTRVTMDGGLERWTYYNYDEQGQIAAKTLIIFGNDGKVVEVNDMSP